MFHSPTLGQPARLLAALVLLVGVLACSSTPDGPPEGVPYDKKVLTANLDDTINGPIAVLLTNLDAEARAWNALTLSADTDQERRQVHILEESLHFRARHRCDDLIAELQSRSVFNRMVAAVALGFSNEDKALGPLIAALDDPSPEVESNALLGIGILAHPDTPTGPLEDLLLHSSNPTTRGNAALALRKVIEAGATSDAVVQTAQAGLIDPEPSVRAQCAILLAAELDTESIDRLVVLLHDKTPLVALAAARALTYIGSNVPESKGECARGITGALGHVESGLKNGFLRSLMHLSQSNYGKDVEAWNEWAHRLP